MFNVACKQYITCYACIDINLISFSRLEEGTRFT